MQASSPSSCRMINSLRAVRTRRLVAFTCGSDGSQTAELLGQVNEPYFGGDLTKLGKNAHQNDVRPGPLKALASLEFCCEGLSTLQCSNEDSCRLMF